MNKLILFIFLLTATFNHAQTGTDNRTYSLKEVNEAPAPEGVGFIEYFKKNFNVKEKPVSVQLSFVVEKGGVVRDIKTFGEVKPEISKEITRVIKASPKWKPGKKDGKTVRVLYTATIKL